MSRNVFWLAILVLLLAACGPAQDTHEPTEAPPVRNAADLKSIKVEPASGKSPFTLTASYVPGLKDDSLECFYIAQSSGGERGDLKIPLPGDSAGSFQATEITHEFEVAAPGKYHLTCWEASSNMGLIDTAADFTVTE